VTATVAMLSLLSIMFPLEAETFTPGVISNPGGEDPGITLAAPSGEAPAITHLGEALEITPLAPLGEASKITPAPPGETPEITHPGIAPGIIAAEFSTNKQSPW